MQLYNYYNVLLLKPNPIRIIKLLRVMIIAFIFCMQFPAFSQDNKFEFSHYTTDDGLSQSNVITILQDSKGFMWFGTQDGLNKFDGYKFTVFKNDPGNPLTLNHNGIVEILEDKTG